MQFFNCQRCCLLLLLLMFARCARTARELNRMFSKGWDPTATCHSSYCRLKQQQQRQLLLLLLKEIGII